MSSRSRKRHVLNLLIIQFLVVVLFVISFVAYLKGHSLFYTGISYTYEALIITIVCILLLSNVIYELKQVK